MKEENTQIENRRTHTADRNLQTERQKKTEMADKKTKTCHRKLKLLSQLACRF